MFSDDAVNTVLEDPLQAANKNCFTAHKFL